MNGEIVFMLILMAAGLVMFVKEVLPIEVTALAILAALVVSGTLTADEAVAGFSNKAAVAIGGLFVLSHALMKTGVLEVAANRLSARSRSRPWLGVGILLASVGVFSGFLNNTAIVAISIPLAMKVCRRLGISPSKVLIPLSYASIFGGTITLIGSSTNLLVSAVAEHSGAKPFGVFEFSGMGLVFLVSGLAYVLVFARPLLPERAAVDDTTEKYRMKDYLTEIIIDEKSKLAGETLRGADVNERYQVTALELIHKGKKREERYVQGLGTIPLTAGDRLIVQGTIDDILRLREEMDVSLLPDEKLTDEKLMTGGQMMVEAWVTVNSGMIGRTLKELDFHQRFGGFVMAIKRVGAMLRKKVAHVELKFSDSLLILIPRDRLEELRRSDDLVILTEREFALRRGRFWWLVFLLLPLVILSAAFGLLEISAGALVGAVVLLLFRVLTPPEAYRAVDWSVVFLIAAFVPVGQAFVKTGTAAFIASGLLGITAWVPAGLAPYVALSTIYLATSLLTQMVSNNAAAIILAPIALAMGPSLGVDSRPFLFAVCFAASAEFMTPMGYQTNLMVYGAGGYRFLDYTKFGAPLNLLFWILGTLLIPVFWPF